MRALALLLTCFTGFAGLVYEVTWQKILAILLGSQSEATAAVLAIFLGGLSLGYALFGGISRRTATGGTPARVGRVLVTYGLVEAAIGCWALVFPLLFSLAQGASAQLASQSLAIAFAFDLVLAALLIGPPTVLMGATIPMLTEGLTRNLADATRVHALVYGVNTAGAFAGALAAGYWLVPSLGLVGVQRAMALVNLAAGAFFVALGRLSRTPAARLDPPTPPGPRTSPEGFGIYAGVALLVGFAMITLQTVLIRVAGLSLGSSNSTFSLVVAVFVLCIALGSFVVSALPRITPGLVLANQWVLALALGLLYFSMQDAPYWTHLLRSLFRDAPQARVPFHLSVFLGVLAWVGVPVVMSGAVLPLLFHRLRREVGDLGSVAGRLYGWNTLGSVAGALLGGYAFYLVLDLDGVFRVAVGALVVAAGLLGARLSRVGWLAAAPALPALAALALLDPWSNYRLSLGTFRFRQPEPTTFAGADAFFSERERRTGERILFYDDDPIASIAVREFPFGDTTSRSILTNGKSDGALVGDYPTMALLAVLPALFAERVERGLVVGWGTGVTAGELAALDSVREVVVAEISSGVIAAAPFFEHGNLGAMTHPKVEIVRTDAHRALQRSQGSFDVIASEPSNPWVSGVEMLFSREFLQAARDRLSPGGVYVQWFPTYETDDETVMLVLRTFASVFGDASVWHTVGPDLLLLGFADGCSDDLDRLLERARSPRFAAALARAGIHSVPALLSHELLPRGVLGALELPGPVHTLLHPLLADRAARAFFSGGGGSLPPSAGLRAARVGAVNSLPRRYAASVGGALSDAEREVMVLETCRYRPRECAVLLAQWLQASPRSESLRASLDIVRRNPQLQGALDEHLLVNLAILFEREPAAPDPGTLLAVAEQATELFVAYYHHAAPFPRAALEAFWSRCQRDPAVAGRCTEERAKVEAQLGPLAVEVAGDTRRGS